MIKSHKSKLLAAAAAGLLGAALAGTASADDAPAKAKKGGKSSELVKCYGVNKCAGSGKCGGSGHACGGKNACKGQGWLKMPKESCDAIEGGSVTPPAAKSEAEGKGSEKK